MPPPLPRKPSHPLPLPLRQLVTRLHDYAALGWHRALDGLPDEVAEVGARAKDRAARQVHGTG